MWTLLWPLNIDSNQQRPDCIAVLLSPVLTLTIQVLKLILIGENHT